MQFVKPWSQFSYKEGEGTQVGSASSVHKIYYLLLEELSQALEGSEKDITANAFVVVCESLCHTSTITEPTDVKHDVLVSKNLIVAADEMSMVVE